MFSGIWGQHTLRYYVFESKVLIWCDLVSSWISRYLTYKIDFVCCCISYLTCLPMNKYEEFFLFVFTVFLFLFLMVIFFFSRRVYVSENTVCQLWFISLLHWYFIAMVYISEELMYVGEGLPRACKVSRPGKQITYNRLEKLEQKNWWT